MRIECALTLACAGYAHKMRKIAPLSDMRNIAHKMRILVTRMCPRVRLAEARLE